MNKLRNVVAAALVFLWVAGCAVQMEDDGQPLLSGEATSYVSKTDANELILIQEISVSAPIEDVWSAYTTDDGWTAWAAPKAKVDLRVGGTIRTAYQGEVGGSDTNTLHIINYVPERILTLRAELSSNWPEIMQKDAEKLSNVVIFDELATNTTRIQSYGVGYTDAPEYDQMMSFFIRANESLYQNLRTYLETGVRVEWGE